MYKNIRSLFLIMVIFALTFSMCCCGKNNSKTNSAVSEVGDDFFTDEETQTDNGNQEINSSANNNSTNNQNQSSDNKTSGKSSKEILASIPKSLKGSKIVIYNWNPMNEYTGAAKVIKEFENKTGIKVEWQTKDFDVYLSQLAAMVAANNPPDLVRLNTPCSIGLQSIQDISTSDFDFSDDAWDKNLMKSYTINGKVYGVSLKNTHIASCTMMLYNTSLISKYELEDPYQLWKNGKWTFSKFKDMCREFMKESGAKFACGASQWSAWTQLYGIEGPVGFDGEKYYNRTGEAKFISISEEMADLYNTEKIIQYWKQDEFDRGECLFWLGASIYARRGNSYFGSLKSAGTLNVVPMPKIDGQDKYYQSQGEYEAYGIAKGAKNAKAAPYFLRYFLDKENYDMNSFFCSKQALEIHNWCMEQPNKIWSTGFELNSRYYGGQTDAFGENYKTLTGSQVATFMKSNNSVIEARIKKLNDAMKDK